MSWDRDEDQRDEYYKTMPWLSLPYEDPRIDSLNSHFEIEGS